MYMCMYIFTPDRQAGDIACVHIHIYTHTYNVLWCVHTLYWQACQDQVTLVTVNVCRYTPPMVPPGEWDFFAGATVATEDCTAATAQPQEC